MPIYAAFSSTQKLFSRCGHFAVVIVFPAHGFHRPLFLMLSSTLPPAPSSSRQIATAVSAARPGLEVSSGFDQVPDRAVSPLAGFASRLPPGRCPAPPRRDLIAGGLFCVSHRSHMSFNEAFHECRTMSIQAKTGHRHQVPRARPTLISFISRRFHALNKCRIESWLLPVIS